MHGTTPSSSTSSSRCSSPLTALSPTPSLSHGSSAPASSPLASEYIGSDAMVSHPVDQGEGEVFYVTRIIARQTTDSPSLALGGVREPHYLVRWWGYGPEDDTWEPRSSLCLTVSKMIDDFDSQEHPFTILACHDLGLSGPKSYQVRYGWSSRREGYSPHAEVVWQTPGDMAIMGIPADSLGVAELAWRTGIQPNPSMPILEKKKVANASKKGKHEGRKGYKILQMLDELPWSKGVSAKYLVNYKIGRRKPKQQWLSTGWANELFGTDIVKEQVSALRAINGKKVKSQGEDKDESREIGQEREVNEYESERLRNIEENQELMRNLGLVV